MQVATVAALWRYPVKSMQGEPLEHARIGPDGIPGDRGIAVIDARTGRILSGKSVQELLAARAVARPGGPAVVLPDGRCVSAGMPEADDAVSAWLGRPVHLRPPGDEARPAIEGEEGPFAGRAGSFFDAAPIHLITTATLAHLSRLHPGGAFDPRRFRANIVLDVDGDGPVERAWLDRRLVLDGLDLLVTGECTRCVMTTAPQADLPRDRDILGTVARDQGNVAGVYARAVEPGVVSVGDRVLLA